MLMICFLWETLEIPDAVQSFDHVGRLLGLVAVKKNILCGVETHPLSRRQDHPHQHERIPARADSHAELTPAETRQLKALPGSLQRLVAQLRFDPSFVVSAPQGEKPPVSTMLRTNADLRELQKDCGFELTFRPVDMVTCGILVVCDAALGNVNKRSQCG